MSAEPVAFFLGDRLHRYDSSVQAQENAAAWPFKDAMLRQLALRVQKAAAVNDYAGAHRWTQQLKLTLEVSLSY